MIHLTPAKLADRHGITVEELHELCERLGVPVVHGRIDRSLFEAALRAHSDPGQPLAAAQASVTSGHPASM